MEEPLQEKENPYQSPKAYGSRVELQPRLPEYENLRRIAICQKVLLFAIALHFMWIFGRIALDALGYRLPSAFLEPASMLGVLMSVTAVALLATRLNGVIAGGMLALLAIVPCADLIIMAAVHGQANRYFHRSGVAAGLFGPRWSDVANATRFALPSSDRPANRATTGDDQ